MTKIKEFLTAHKDQIVIVLSALSAMVATLEGFGGTAATVCAIFVAIIAALSYVIKNGVNDTAISLVSSAIQLIIKGVSQVVAASNESTDTTTEEVVTAKKVIKLDQEKSVSEMTKDEIAEELNTLMGR